MTAPFRISREVYVPQLENGSLHYTIMEIVAASDADSGWAVKDMKDLPVEPFPAATGPSTKSYAAIDGFDTRGISKTGLSDGAGWTRGGGKFE